MYKYLRGVDVTWNVVDESLKYPNEMKFSQRAIKYIQQIFHV